MSGEFVEFEPNYDEKCLSCKETPTVNIVRGEVVIRNSKLCGVCYFGTAKAVDTTVWDDC